MKSLGYIDDLLKIAMEAEDVTQEAKAQASSTGANETTGNNDEERDMSNTDDIFGLKDNGSSGEGDNNASSTGDDSSSDDDFGGDFDDMGDDMSSDDFGEGDDSGGDDSTGEDIPDASKKMVLKDNLYSIYTSTKGIIKQLSDYKFNTADDPAPLSTIMDNLASLQNAISKILLGDFKKLEYTQALTKYISVKKTYDICTQMLYEHFDNLHKDTEKKEKQ